MSSKKKIGLLFGSFDPPHIGHLNAAVKAFEKEDLEAVWVIPAWQNPWKDNKPVDIDDRALMFSFMIGDMMDTREGNSLPIIVKNLEGMLKPEYTYEVINYLVYEWSDFDFYIIGGQDIHEQITKWKNAQFILDNCKFIEIDRNEINISSTVIRERIRENKPLTPFLTKHVIKFLEVNPNLYKAND